MDENKIVLDRKAFGALAVDSRVKILKALKERRKMLTELSDEMKLSASSTKEHLDTLVDAGLISRIDDGHKWKYYELTRKGSEIVTPDREIRVWVLLGMSVVGLASAAFLMMAGAAVPMQVTASDATGNAPLAGAVPEAGRTMVTTAAALPTASQNASSGAAGATLSAASKTFPAHASALVQITPQFILAVASAIVLVCCVAYLAKKKMDSDKALKGN